MLALAENRTPLPLRSFPIDVQTTRLAAPRAWQWWWNVVVPLFFSWLVPVPSSLAVFQKLRTLGDWLHTSQNLKKNDATSKSL